METAWQTIGDFQAVVNPRLDTPRLRSSLAQIHDLLAAPGATLLQGGRHKTIRIELDSADGPIDAVAKVFGRQSLPKDLWDKMRGSKAWRTYAASDFLADAAIGTTPPIACLERWEGCKLAESYFISLFVADMACCKDLLVDLWKSKAHYAAFENLMRIMAKGIRKLHDAGCIHGDLGNQNIFFTRRAKGLPYEDALFLDLNRARFGHPLEISERAKDLCRIALPLGFFPAFFKLYWEGDPPAGFADEWWSFRVPFRIHTATRKFRHPLRELSYKLDPSRAPAQAPYPPDDRQWVWDAARFRPAAVLSEARQLKLLDKKYRAKIFRDCERMKQSLDVRRQRRDTADLPPRDSAPPILRVIVAGLDSRHAGDLADIQKAGATKALVRFSMSDPDETTEAKLRGAAMLAANGIGVAALVVQAPRFLAPGFAKFARRIADTLMDRLKGKFDWIAAGQGVNTVSWGLRSEDDVKDVIAAGEKLVFDHPARSINVAACAVESPILQPGCGNISELFGRNVQYSAVTLAWDRASGPVAEEVRILRALASRTFYARRKIILVCDTPWQKDCPQERELRGLVSEICSAIPLPQA